MARWPTCVKEDLLLRFGDKVLIGDGCWEWLGSHHERGYGTFWNGEKNVKAHRWLYELLVGPIPEGFEPDHLCRNTACVRPSHLEPVTHVENVLRGEGACARNARKTHCKHGHEFTDENTGRQTGGGRYCRTCMRINNARRYGRVAA
jgi:hypothetical protein